MRISSDKIFIITLFLSGFILYLYGLLSAYGFKIGSNEFSLILFTTVAGGLACIGLGYGSVVVVGGMVSLKLVEFVSRFTRSKHIIEPAEQNSQPTFRDRVAKYVPVIAIPFVVFVLSASLAWDIHNLHDPRTSFFHPILHELDVFARPITNDPASYAFEVILVMVILIAIAGVVPSLVFPYFREFKITGVNSGPFHTDLLVTVVGSVAGFGVILTLVGLVFQVMWTGTGPYYFHYVIPVMMGLSLQYSCGILTGQKRSEEIVKKRLESHDGKRVLRGSVNIRLKDDKS